MRKLFLLFFLLSSTSSLFAQCPQNIGFELNNLSGWRSYIDTINCNSAALSCFGASPSCYGNPGLASLALQVCNSLGPNKQINNTNSSRHNTIKVVNSAGTSNNPGPNDPFSGLPMVCPASGNNYSLQLGNAERGAHAERVISQFLVTGVNSSLIYRYAAVMEDISLTSHHTRVDRPRLAFAVYDIGTPLVTNPTPIKIECASFIQWLPTLDSVYLYPGWFAGSSNTVCSNWIPVAVNLSSYVGHIIQMVFTTADCAQTGHFGYAYIDIPNGCKPFTISTGFCPGQDTAFLHAPSGFSHYDWYNYSASPPIWLGTGKDLQTPTSQFIGYPSPVAVGVVVTPPAGIGCNDTLIDSLRVLPPPTAGFTWNQNICAGSPVQFLDTSNTHVAGSSIIHWEWDYNGDGITDDTVPNPFHTFANTGTYTIRLIVKSDLSCISDTAFGQIVNVTLPAIHPNAGNDTSICQGATVQLNGSTYPNYSYNWYTLNGVSAPANGLSNDTISNPIASPLVSTTYYYKITDTINECFFIDSIRITINGVSPNVMIQASKDTICPLSSANLDVVNNMVACGPTLVYCNGTPASHAVSSGSANINTYPTIFSASIPDGKVQMLILASELTAASINPGEIEGITFNVTAKNSTTPFRLFTVKMGCTTLNAYPTNSSFQTTSVVASYNTYTSVIGANYIPLQNKFMWDGTSNLVVEICYSNVVTSSNDLMAQTTTSFNSVIYGFSFGGNPSGCAITSGSMSANRPNIAFTTCTSSFAGATYAWSPAAAITGSTTIKNPVAHPLATTTYSCLINDGNGCTSTVTKTIVVDNTTSINLGNDTTICNGQIYVPQPITGGVAPYSYTWTSTPIGTNSNLATPSLSPSVTTTYTLNFHGYHNCAVSDNVVVHVNPIPTSSFTVNPNPVCSADTAIVTYIGNAPASANYLWNFGAGSTIIAGTGKGPYKIKWSSTGTKSVTLMVTNNGCSSTTTTLQVLVNLSPTPTFTVNPTIICTGAANVATITYNGNAPSTSIYNWNFDGGTVVSGSGQGAYNVYWTNSGTANVKLTITEAGCTASQIVPTVVNLTPTSNFSVSPIAACSGQNLTINYTGNMPCPNGLSTPFSWNFGTPTVSPGGTSCGPHTLSYSGGGTYNITLNISNNGCVSTTTTIPVTITQTPTSAFSVVPNSVCSGNITNVTYAGNAGATAGYSWNVTGVTNPVHISGNGPFNVSWTDNGNAVVNENITLTVSENGCTSSTTTIPVAVTPNPTADFMVTSPVCAGADATVTYIGVNNTSSASYFWNWGSGNQTSGSGKGPYTIVWPTSGMQYPSLTVSQNGCASSLFTVPVDVLANPIVQAHPDTSICPHTMVSLWAEGANSYVWTYDNSTMPGLNVIPAASPTTYTVIGTDNSGCKGTGTVTVLWRALPAVNAGNDTTINRGNTVHIGSKTNIPNYTYWWNSNPSTFINQDTTGQHLYYTTASPINTTMFILLVEDKHSCKNADTVNVVVKGCTQLEVPNAFIPEGANNTVNKTFRAANTKALLSLTRFEVYNRWGVKIFSSTDKDGLGWDGKYNGVDQEMGSYTYYIEGICEDGIPVHKEGNVTLVR